MQNYLLAAGFVFGAIIGSFLNVCIYRIPRGISLIDPARSFCPECRRSIPFHLNIPILSWLLLRGRCASCYAPINPRYLIVEVFTAALFAIAVWRIPLPTVFSVWVILSILIVTTFVDLEFLIIPDVISKGGIVAGLLLSLITPGLHNTSAPFAAAVSSIIGGATGALILYLIGEVGKLAFGHYKVALDTPANFSLESLPNDDLLILIGDESFLWSEHFVRPSDRIVLHTTDLEINGISFQNIDLTFFHDRVVADREAIGLDKIKSLSGHTTGGQFPREAMGFGDVKLVAAIGTFAGWQGTLFTIAGGAFVGAAFSIVSIALGQRARSAKIPFGPYLAIAAVVWFFWGDTIGLLYARTAGLAACRSRTPGVQELQEFSGWEQILASNPLHARPACIPIGSQRSREQAGAFATAKTEYTRDAYATVSPLRPMSPV